MARKRYVGRGTRPARGRRPKGSTCMLSLVLLPFIIANFLMGQVFSLTKRPKGSACGVALLVGIGIYVAAGYTAVEALT